MKQKRVDERLKRQVRKKLKKRTIVTGGGTNVLVQESITNNITQGVNLLSALEDTAISDYPADGDVLVYNDVTGLWVNEQPTGGGGGGGGGTPGGADTQVQYNNAGAFGGITGATTDGTNLSVITPTTANHAANKSYVDTVVISESEYAKIQAIWYHLNSF